MRSSEGFLTEKKRQLFFFSPKIGYKDETWCILDPCLALRGVFIATFSLLKRSKTVYLTFIQRNSHFYIMPTCETPAPSPLDPPLSWEVEPERSAAQSLLKIFHSFLLQSARCTTRRATWPIVHLTVVKATCVTSFQTQQQNPNQQVRPLGLVASFGAILFAPVLNVFA